MRLRNTEPFTSFNPMQHIMKTTFLLLLFSATTLSLNAQFIYVSPQPGSALHQPQTNILLRTGSALDASSIADAKIFTITGSKSGDHAFRIKLSNDDRTIILDPTVDFAWDETISVIVTPGIRKNDGGKLAAYDFTFSTRKQPSADDLALYKEIERQRNIEEFGFDPTEKKPTRGPNGVYDSLATYKILVNNNPAPGQVFYNNQNDMDEFGTNCFATIINNDGSVMWARDLGLNGHDFKINYNGYLTYFSYEKPVWIMLDSNYNQIDSFRATNGYDPYTNGHDFIIYPDGHYYLIAFDAQTIDMTPYGGQPNAVVTGLIIQGFDGGKNLVFEWRSWDHIAFTDANAAIPLTAGVVDYVHGNAIEEWPDGNLVYSSRSCCEIVKVNTQTGDIIWRLGGENNQFTFFNDPTPEHFRFQHDIRRLPNGNITLFNNGNTQTVLQSAAKEYALDETNKTATLAWQYVHPDVNGNHVFSTATGSVQRLENGNTLIDWGTVIAYLGFPHITEVNPQNEIVWEFKFDTIGMKTYRAHKYVWDPCSRPTSSMMSSTVNGSKAKLSWSRATNAKKFRVEYRPLANTQWISQITKQTKITINNLSPNTTYVWRIKSLCSQTEQSAYTSIDTFMTPLRFENLMSTEEPVQWTVFPNPVSDELTLSPVDATQTPVTVTIQNSLGSQLLLRKWETADIDLKLNVSDLEPGIYFLTIASADQRLTKKFVKQ
jgi:hypothetical protein